MPLDGIYIYSITNELKNLLLNGKVDKINQPEKDEIILSIRAERSSYKLLLSASSTIPKIHLTNVSKENPMKAPMFCMVLRKYLSNARIIDISQIDTDRIVVMSFESLDDMGYNSVYKLVIEIMGRHSNITLIRERDNIVMDSIKHITPDINSYRSLYPNIPYVSPPESTRLNPFASSIDDVKTYIMQNNLEYSDKFFSMLYTGVSSQFSKDIVKDYENSVSKLSSCQVICKDINELIEYSQPVFNKLKNNEFTFLSYKQNGTVKDFYCTQLKTLHNLHSEMYNSPSKLLEDFYYEKDRADRINTRSSDLQKVINNNLDRCYKKLNILNETLKQCDEKDKFKINGELLTANIYSIKKGDKKTEVLNYYSEEGEIVSITLDENKSPSENIQAYFKKYNKLKKSEEMAKVQIKFAEDEIEYLQSVLTSIFNISQYQELEEIKQELMESGYIKFRKSSKQKIKPSKPLHFVSSDGIDLYVGKNNFQNDYLTLKFAEKHDTWLHTKNIPGSHVIIKHFGQVPDKTLEEAAILAAFYSKAKDSTKVAVDYTEVRNVKKPSGAKPGMVIYYTNKTVYVDPYDIKLEKSK